MHFTKTYYSYNVVSKINNKPFFQESLTLFWQVLKQNSFKWRTKDTQSFFRKKSFSVIKRVNCQPRHERWNEFPNVLFWRDIYISELVNPDKTAVWKVVEQQSSTKNGRLDTWYLLFCKKKMFYVKISCFSWKNQKLFDSAEFILQQDMVYYEIGYYRFLLWFEHFSICEKF